MDIKTRDSSGPGSMTGMPVDSERLQEFDRILQKYKAGKAHLEKRVVAAEQWWKLRNESEERKKGIGWDESFRAKSGWLHNVIVSKHADAMESYPEPMVLPREPGDREEAKKLSSVLPVILEQNNFERTYSDCAWQKLKTGTAVYKITWDADKLNGLGDVDIARVDLLSVFWEPGVTDIQKSRYFFHCELQDNELLEQQYPQLKDKLKGNDKTLTRFIYDDAVGTDGKSVVVDVYYKVVQDGRTVLHYCKYVNDEILESTENEGNGMPEEPVEQPVAPAPAMPEDESFGLEEPPVEESTMPPMMQQPMGPAPMMPPVAGPEPVETEHYGLYDHGMYPFVFDPLWPVEGSPAGYGYVDLCMNTQIQIDMLDTAMLKNAMVGATPRYFERVDGSINEAEFKDINKPIVHVQGSTLDDTGIRPIDYNPLAGAYLNFYSQKITEIRETSGNTESANGIYSGGVTAASSIAALQEASGKTSRDSSRASYRSFAEMVNMILELIRQFYKMPRYFRIMGDDGQQEFVLFDNAGMQPQMRGVGSEELGMVMPIFDIKVEVQKRNAYTRTSQNELALQLYQLMFFDPRNATPATMCLDMMDFEGKDDLLRKISMNGTLEQQLQQVEQLLLAMAQKYEPNNVQNLVSQLGMGAPVQAGGGNVDLGNLTEIETGEAGNVTKARMRSNQATNPEKGTA